ncbi:MAG: hypothetical protein JWO76_2265 [Nocardioides sp.]|nr:hypothetical protein [Nocardioides sp.]
MIGYYVHHQGAGHAHHALAVARELDVPVTGLSSLPRPPAWTGPWVELVPDDSAPSQGDVTAGGRLHWAPLHDDGLRGRMAAVSAWITEQRPALLVADVSVEVALLARLHGVPVVSVVLPGRRGDEPHRLGYGVSTALVAPWPESATGLVTGLSATDRRRLQHVGGLSRFPVADDAPSGTSSRRVTVLLGNGGGQPGPECWAAARAATPGWEWTVLGRAAGSWTENPSGALRRADVVITHAGLGALAEVAAARRPAVVVPAARPHEEQATTARALAWGPWPVLVERSFPTSGWPRRLEQARALDGTAWSSWTDGGAAARFADVLRGAMEETGRPVPA